MDRRQFFESIGIGAAFTLTATCLQSCKHDPDFIAPPGVTTNGTTTTTTTNGFTINLEDPAYAVLKQKGSYVVVKGVVIAKDNAGNFVAATQVCSHAARPEVYYTSVLNDFYCPAHGARFSLTGSGLNSRGTGGLKIYKTELKGSILQITL